MSLSSSVIILMATYNGEHYIKKQIDSICSQTYQDWMLIIRDDGSSDNTREIIQNYCNTNPRIKLLQNNSNQHGAYLNFWTLINYAKNNIKFDYCFFADQDDIWLSSKLEAMTNYAKQFDETKPLMIYSDMQLIDGNDQVTLNSVNSEMGIGAMCGLTEYYSSGFIWGCASLINYRLMEIVPVFPLNRKEISIVSHDNYYAKFCLGHGEIHYFDQVCIQHRRHSENVTSGNNIKMTTLMAIKRLLFGYQKTAKTHAGGYKQTLLTIEMMKHSNLVTQDALEVEKAIKKGGLYGVRMLKKHYVRRKQWSRTIGIYTIMFLKSYKKYM